MSIYGHSLKIRITLIIMLLLATGFISCALFRNVEPDDFTKTCSHCHGGYLEGVNNVKASCGECHDIDKPLSPGNIEDEEIRESLTSEPHIHKIGNVFTGTPSCFYCHRENDF